MIKITTEEGKEMEVYTPEEVAEFQKQTEEHKTAAETARQEAEEAKKNVAKMQGVLADKNDNFKRYKDMTEEEKSKLSADQVEAIKRADAAEAKATSLEEKFNADIKQRVETFKNKVINGYAMGDEAVKKQIEENMNMINIDGTDEETIHKKVDLAVRMMGDNKPKFNPFHQVINGEAPKAKDDFMETDRAKAAKSALGEVKF